MKDWWLDELTHAGREHLEETYVASYERKAGFDPTEDLDVLSRHGLDPDSTVIDIGAGVGMFAIAVAPRCREVIAVDVSAAMTAAMRGRVAQDGLNNVIVVEAGFLSYEHDGLPVDFVYTRNALHQLPDFWKGIALQRLAGTLRAGGILRLRDLVFDFERVRWLSGEETMVAPAPGTLSVLAAGRAVGQKGAKKGVAKKTAGATKKNIASKSAPAKKSGARKSKGSS